MVDQIYLRLCLIAENIISDHNDKPYGCRIGTLWQVPIGPNKVFDAERSSLLSELATKGSVGGDDDGYSRALSEGGAKDGNRLP